MKGTRFINHEINFVGANKQSVLNVIDNFRKHEEEIEKKYGKRRQ